MNLYFWKEEFVRDLDSAVARAKAGAAYLDRKFGPKWEREIDLDRLDIASPFHCVLGQLGAKGHHCMLGPRWGVDYGFGCGFLTDTISLVTRFRVIVRSHLLLTQAWKMLICHRRQQREWRPERLPARPEQRAAERRVGLLS